MKTAADWKARAKQIIRAELKRRELSSADLAQCMEAMGVKAIHVSDDCAIWAVYPPKKVVSRKVKAFVGFLVERLGQPPYWDRS